MEKEKSPGTKRHHTLSDKQNRIFEEVLEKNHDLMVALSEGYAKESKKCDVCNREYIDKRCWEFCPLCGFRLTKLNVK